MILTDVLERLYARRRFGIRPGVDRVAKLLRRLGNPEKQFRSIHVVGTNGKGSTSAFISSILTHSGHKVGQFSSPHLIRFTERFRIDGKEYSSEKLAEALDYVLEVAPEETTFFEITTALAALIFCEERVELAVMEAGMGGRSDATAVFGSEMTVITPVALDHSDYLGTTVEEIAREKTGIIKPGTVVISADQTESVRLVIEKQCLAQECILRTFGNDFSILRNSDGTLDYLGMGMTLTQLKSGLAGSYQSGNAALALAAAEWLETCGMSIGTTAFKNGIAATYWPGRMELIPGTPPLLLDGAHNPAGAVALAKALSEYSYSRLLMVTGVCEDKDIDQIFLPLIPLVDVIFTVTPSVDRGINDGVLSGYFNSLGIKSIPCSSAVAGVCKARTEASSNDLILICGSLFVVGEVKAWLEQVDYTGIRG